MENLPRYGLSSVDRALQLALLLRDEGPMRVSDAALRLGVAPSTAHRLFSALAHRGFAEQGEDRRYYAAEAWTASGGVGLPTDVLAALATPHLQVLVSRVDETANLQVRSGTSVRFIASVSCTRLLRVGDRTGRVLPANLASGGKVLLAGLSHSNLQLLYAGRETLTKKLLGEIAAVRRRGYALNNQETEQGVTALSVVVPSTAAQEPLAAVSLALPSVRFRRENVPALVRELTATADDIAKDFAANASRLQ
jgi:IclR family acetate operon transcriptional repressor